MRSEADVEGHDLVLEANGVIRHVQLKAKARGGRRNAVNAHKRLASRPSACIIWIIYNPENLRTEEYLWFGSHPGHPIPDLGDRIVKHSRANSHGVKQERPNHRLVAGSRFEKIGDSGTLSKTLFGVSEGRQFALIEWQLKNSGPASVSNLATQLLSGNYAEIQEDICWRRSAELAHLIDGYELASELGLSDPGLFLEQQWQHAEKYAIWHGTAAELWLTLFLSCKEEHFAGELSGGTKSRQRVRKLMMLDQLCQQLRMALVNSVPD